MPNIFTINDSTLVENFIKGGVVGDSKNFTTTTSFLNFESSVSSLYRLVPEMEPTVFLIFSNITSKHKSDSFVIAYYSYNRKVILVNSREIKSNSPSSQEAVDLVTQSLEHLGYYNTATTKEGKKLYCPLACEDCVSNLACALVSEEKRCRIAKPEVYPEFQETNNKHDNLFEF